MIRAAELSDAETLSEIYNHYILNTHVTFEEDAIDVDEMRSRLSETWSVGLP